MLFDRLAGYVERYTELDQLKGWMDEAHLFELRDLKMKLELLGEQIRLPFEVIAIQTEGAVILLQEGRFIAATEDDKNSLIIAGLWRSEVGDQPNLRKIGVAATWFCRVYRATGQISPLKPNVIEVGMQEKIAKMAYVSLAQTIAGALAAINQLDRFVVEVEPSKRIEATPSRVVRSHNRNEYILLRPHEIRVALGLPNPPGRGHKRPHERRGHYRTFRAARFGPLRGQRRWIKAMWVGPREAVVNKRRYRVLPDC